VISLKHSALQYNPASHIEGQDARDGAVTTRFHPHDGCGTPPRSIPRCSRASASEPVDAYRFGYLMAQAAQKAASDGAKATTAAPRTLPVRRFDLARMVRQHVASTGRQARRFSVTCDATGRPHVADPAVRQSIWPLRKDPRISAALAGEFAQRQQAEVERALGRPAETRSLYRAPPPPPTPFLARRCHPNPKAIQKNARPGRRHPARGGVATRGVFDGRTANRNGRGFSIVNFSNKIEKNATPIRPSAQRARAARRRQTSRTRALSC